MTAVIVGFAEMHQPRQSISWRNRGLCRVNPDFPRETWELDSAAK